MSRPMSDGGTPSAVTRRSAGLTVAQARRPGAALLMLSALLVACGSSSPGPASTGELLTPSAPTIDPGPGPATFEAEIRLETVVSGLDDPVAVVARPMRNQLWIAERSGRVRLVTRITEWDITGGKVQRSGYRLEPDPVLDISELTTTTGGTRGLLSLAFSTDGQTLYIHHSDLDGALIVAGYTVTDPFDIEESPAPPAELTSDPAGTGGTSTTTASPDLSATAPTTAPAPPRAAGPAPIGRPAIAPGTRVELINIDREGAVQHDGGHITVGPDGYLYISTGGTGPGIDPGAAQDPNSLRGKILRIDPSMADGTRPYAIPSDNPFATGGGAPEVWAMGMRDPRRFSFDRTGGDLWIGDAGSGELEEIDVIARDRPPGVNLGWPVRLGDQPDQPGADDGVSAFSEFTEPVLVYPRTEDRCAVIGGYVYRGAIVRDLEGVYLYADRCTGELRGLLSRRGVVLTDKRLSASIEPSTLNGFGQDDQGELYVLTTAGTLSLIASAS